jgi:hypothetical protein
VKKGKRRVRNGSLMADLVMSDRGISNRGMLRAAGGLKILNFSGTAEEQDWF